MYLGITKILDFTPSTGAYQTFTTNPITITSTSETLTFVGLTDPSGNNDHTTFIDDVTGVQTAAVPEAGLYGVLAVGLSGLLIAFRRRKIA